MNLTKERIDLLNTINSNSLELEIRDLKNEDGSAKGTKVNLRVF